MKLNEIDKKNRIQMTFKDILDFPVEAGEVEPTSVRNTLESGLSRAKMVD